MTEKLSKEENLSGTISNCASRPHTHVTKGGGRMHHQHELIPTYDTTTLSKETAAYLGDLFIEQLTKVALHRLDGKSVEETENLRDC